MKPLSRSWILLWTIGVSACLQTPPAVTPQTPAVVLPTYEQKLRWILHLEDHRALRDNVPPPPAAASAAGVRNQNGAAPAPADLTQLLTDNDPRIRRLAAQAVGRVGLADGVPPLLPLVQDPDPDVRQMACFALGLLHDARATDALLAALRDTDLRVQGRAAEALGAVGDTKTAAPIGELVGRMAADPAVTAMAPDDVTYPVAPAADAFRLGLYALVKLKAWDAMAGAVLDGSGNPKVNWWPVAYAVQRIEDPRAVPALLAFARGTGVENLGFAARGLGVLKEPKAVPLLLAMLDPVKRDVRVVASAVRALGLIGQASAADPLIKILRMQQLPPGIRVETMTALGLLKARSALDDLLDLISHTDVSVRGAALIAVATIDQDTFITALSGIDPDPAWQVRADLARALGHLPREQAVPQLTNLVHDDDLRVVEAAMRALGDVKAPTLLPILRENIVKDDLVIRAASAELVGETKSAGGEELLRAAWQRGKSDASYVARAAALAGLAKYGLETSRATLEEALADPDWAVRVRAAQLLTELDPRADVSRIRPANVTRGVGDYDIGTLMAPPYSTHVYLETRKGTVQVELTMLDAPLTVANFVALARRGFLNGVPIHRVVPNFVVQHGDPRGDGQGGPGYTIRDEVNQRPYLRGTVGMALDWADTGGSQFFITHGPQPHLDGRYTVFGSVVSGMDVVDRLERWDVIDRVRVWDGVQPPTR